MFDLEPWDRHTIDEWLDGMIAWSEVTQPARQFMARIATRMPQAV